MINCKNEKLDDNKTNKPAKKWAKDMNKHFFQRIKYIELRHMKKKMLRISSHRGNANKTTVSFPLIPAKMTTIQKQNKIKSTNAGDDVGGKKAP